MKLIIPMSLFATKALAIATLYMTGDSTMSDAAYGRGTIGWGKYFPGHINSQVVSVVNYALAGRSLRSFTREGKVKAICDKLKKGDGVLMQFGHNDGANPYHNDNGRSDCPGSGNEICEVTYGGQKEYIKTYPAYLVEAGKCFQSKGAYVFISGPTPNNVYESGRFVYDYNNRFTQYSRLAVQRLGGPSRGAYFVDGGGYAAQAMRNLGKDYINAQYTVDHTHTSYALAKIIAESFALGLKCGTSRLGRLVTRTGGSYLGGCIPGGSS